MRNSGFEEWSGGVIGLVLLTTGVVLVIIAIFSRPLVEAASSSDLHQI